MLKYLAVAATVLTTATPSFAFLATNNLPVTSEAPGEFIIEYYGSSAARDFWCAAGDYAERRLNLPTATMIYRVSPPPRRSGEGVSFSTDPQRSSGQSGLIRLTSGDKGGMTVARARQYCNDHIYR